MLHFGRTPSHYAVGHYPSKIIARPTNLGFPLPAAFTGYGGDLSTRGSKSIRARYWRRVLSSSVSESAAQSLLGCQWGFVEGSCSCRLWANYKSGLRSVQVELSLATLPIRIFWTGNFVSDVQVTIDPRSDSKYRNFAAPPHRLP